VEDAPERAVVHKLHDQQRLRPVQDRAHHLAVSNRAYGLLPLAHGPGMGRLVRQLQANVAYCPACLLPMAYCPACLLPIAYRPAWPPVAGPSLLFILTPNRWGLVLSLPLPLSLSHRACLPSHG
jgi:hypothetical protein